MDKKLEERLRKLAALASGGVGGEKESAQRFLDRLLDENGLTLADLEEKSVVEGAFVYTDESEKALLVQIICVCLNTDRISSEINRKLKTLYLKTTKMQRLEIQLMFDHYKALLRQEFKFFIEAFFYKNNLYPSADFNNNSASGITIETMIRARKVASMARLLERRDYRRNLPEGKAGLRNET